MLPVQSVQYYTIWTGLWPRVQKKEWKSIGSLAVRVVNVLLTTHAGNTVLDTCPHYCAVRACIGRYTSLHIHPQSFPHLPSVVNITPYSPLIFTTYIHHWFTMVTDQVREPYYTCVWLLVDVHVTLWRMSMEPGVAVYAGYWVLFWSWLQSWMVAVNMETYKYNSTFSLSEYWRIFTSYTNLGFASVCILVNIRQYSLRLKVLLYTYCPGARPITHTYKPAQRAIREFMDRSRRAGIGQWHEYDHVVCNIYIVYTKYTKSSFSVSRKSAQYT